MPPKTKPKDEGDEPVTTWDIADEISHTMREPLWAVKNVMKLLKEENTIPFIARYRKEQTNNMDGEKLRELESVFEELQGIQNRISSIFKTLEKTEKLSPALKSAFANAKTASEVEHLYQPFKTGNKRTMAKRASELGLDPAAEEALCNPIGFMAPRWVKQGTKGLENVKEVETGVQHIIADRISKDKDTIEFLIRDVCGRAQITIESHQSTAAKKDDKENRNDAKEGTSKDGKKVDNSVKFENYYNFKCPIRNIRPHQVLAINRGESLKVLTVKIDIPPFVKDRFTDFSKRHWLRAPPNHPSPGVKVIIAAIEDCFTRLMIPLVTRHFRNELKKMAEKASLEVFRENLKNLLLAPPVRGQTVLGLDPGFRNGCKIAVVDAKGAIKDTSVVYLNHGGFNQRDERLLGELISRHRVDVVAIGNGTACRETEVSISRLIEEFRNVSYVIVDESGASIYSVTPDAEKEMPGMDPNLRSAASIARRLQDPLAELVKIEPRHIGVGMYQHDVDEKQLKTSLDKVVEDCVSFVGVDANTASVPLLSRIAGLTAARAKKVVEWREQNGAFTNRDQLKLVSGLGPKSFEQCAGFLRINPASRDKVAADAAAAAGNEDDDEPPKKKAKTTKTTAKSKKKAETNSSPEALDMTCIHPESYEAAHRVVKAAGLDIKSFEAETKRQDFQTQLQKWSLNVDREKVSTDLSIGVPTLDLILRGLTQPVDFDLRQNADKPLFRRNIAAMKDLHTGLQLTGRVTNVTHFGAFVDIGVERQGLIHVSRMGARRDALQLGDRVEVGVVRVDFGKGRIELQLTSDNNKAKIKLQ